MKHQYNITFNVEDDVRDQWLRFMQEELIPAMLASGLLKEAVLSELMVDEPQGTSYALLFTGDSGDDVARFRSDELGGHLEQLRRRYGDKVVFFPTEMKVIRRYPRREKE
ncbi:MAG: DUF4286 family protein [Chlorobi bacterium]|nr:DUF4286 family protein [Chlorobiota bacterium]